MPGTATIIRSRPRTERRDGLFRGHRSGPQGALRDEAPDTAAASRGRVMNDEPPAKDDGRRLIVRM